MKRIRLFPKCVFQLSIILVGIILFSSHLCYAQNTKNEHNGAILSFGLGFGLSIPMQDYKVRFGNAMHFTPQIQYINQSNWVFSASSKFVFGDQVKEDVLSVFRTPNGLILGDDSQVAAIFLRHRGLWLGAGVGKLFSWTTNKKSGIKISTEVGIMQHNIRFLDERNAVAQLRIGRSKGYDRLTRGWAINPSIGYVHHSRDKRINYELLADLSYSRTKDVRAFQFDTGLANEGRRNDMLMGLTFLWKIPVYLSEVEKEIYY